MTWLRPDKERGVFKYKYDQTKSNAERENIDEWWEKVKDLPAPRLYDPLHHAPLDGKMLFQRGKRCLPQAL